MFVRVLSASTVGLEGFIVKVEVDVASRGFPKFNIVGLASKSVDEAKERVRAAMVNSEFEMPDTRITVNLAPADIPKNGSNLDLPIAVGILAASGFVDKDSFKDALFVGELSLKGEIKNIAGALPVADLARDKKIKKIFVPLSCAPEASLVSGISVFAVESLTDLVMHLNGTVLLKPFPKAATDGGKGNFDFVFENIRGQETAKRAMEIAAAGFHNIHLKGPPGSGKTLLSKSLISILPPMEEREIIEVTRIYSIAGLLNGASYIADRPFRNPHHTVSRVGLIGGGSDPMPGEISLSHRGVLFLDEFPEFAHSAIESLRSPVEDGQVTITRAARTLTYPCRFILLAASNPCPCGYLGHPKKICRCSPGAVFKYRKKISGPIIDRIDINIDVPPVKKEDLTGEYKGESSQSVKKRVVKAYEIQRKRFSGSGISTNSQMFSSDIKKYCVLDPDAETLLKSAIDRLSLSARSYFKTIKIARTIADLKGIGIIDKNCIAEALQFRANDG